MSAELLPIILAWKPLGYLLIFIGMAFEGDILLFATAFLTFQGYFNLKYIIPVVFLGVTLGDIAWYWMGHKLNNKSHWKINDWMNRAAKPFDKHLIKRPYKTIIISKFTYGLHHALLVRAGSINMPMRQYIKIDFIANIIWILTIGCLAYFSKTSFDLAKQYIHYAEVSFFLGVLIFFILWHIISIFFSKEL